MKTKLFTIAMMVAFIMTTMMKVQAQNFEGPCLPSMHGLDDHQSAFCGSTVTQTIALSAGTNWFSTYLEITLDDLKAALRQASPSDNNVVVISQNNGQVKWNGHLWTGQLRALDVAQMYQIQVSAPCEITLEGMPIDPAAHPITIVANSTNWIGFPFAESMSISDAFAGFSTRNDFIKSGDGGQANWNGHLWTGGLKNLEPGKGYKYTSKATENKTFVYPTSAK